MNRRKFIQNVALASTALWLSNKIKASNSYNPTQNFCASDFGNFIWGVATAAYQIEGAYQIDGKGLSIWDTFTQNGRRIKDKSDGKIACDFYHRFESDLDRLAEMGFRSFRFSISWPRVMPQGVKEVNIKGIDYYQRLIDACLKRNIKPWITLYHWDLPQSLEDRGGWLNRNIIDWFGEYAYLCGKAFGDRVENWIVLNEPLSFTLFGYGIGIHAPGKVGIDKFFRAAHHAALAQAEGGRVLRQTLNNNCRIGTTFSCSPVEPYKTESIHDVRAATRIDAVVNRMFVEPLLGWGYPYREAPILRRIDKHMLPDDEQKLTFDFDFWGLQHYFRIVVRGNHFIPIVKAYRISPSKLGETTTMDWEIHPESLYNIVQQFRKYPVKELVITESGASFNDIPDANGFVNDSKRIEYFRRYLEQLLRAKKDGAPVSGYFVWTLMDNFEWAEGYQQRFGLLYTDFKTQQRFPKHSAIWWTEFLNEK